MKKIIITLISFIIIILIAIGTFFKKSNKTESKKLQNITVAEVAHSIFYAPMYVTDSLGYFEEEGLSVEIILTSGADSVAAAVLSDDVQIGFCGSEQSIYIYNQGSDDYLINFAGLTKRDGSFIVSRSKDNFDIKNLVGKHIIAGREGGMPAMTLAYTLKEHGININDLKFDTSIAFASMAGAFIGGTGDYVSLFEPTALEIEKQGYGHVVVSLGQLGGEVPYTTFSAKKSYIENNPNIIKSFSKAIQKGLDYTFNHTDKEIAKLLVEYFPDTSLEDLEEVVKRYRDADSWYSTTYITEEGFKRVQDIMKNSNELDKEAPYNILVNNEYNKK